jgi:beta-phosphoglucomutase-like phosphatase (HAD superfamily)
VAVQDAPGDILAARWAGLTVVAVTAPSPDRLAAARRSAGAGPAAIARLKYCWSLCQSSFLFDIA